MLKRRDGVGYSRCSTIMQVEDGHSLETQQRQIEEYISGRKINLKKIYTDPGISAKDMNRPQFKLMMSELTTGTVIIVTALSRLTRSTRDLPIILDELKKKGCFLAICDMEVDTSSALGEFSINIMIAVAQLERKQIAERVSIALNSRADQGKLRCRPRYGYKVVDKKLLECPEEKAIINRIIDIIKDKPTIGVTSIIKILESEGITKIRNGNKIYHNQIKAIINDNNLRPNVNNHITLS